MFDYYQHCRDEDMKVDFTRQELRSIFYETGRKECHTEGHKDLRRLCGCFVQGRGGNDWKQREQVEKQGGRRWV